MNQKPPPPNEKSSSKLMKELAAKIKNSPIPENMKQGFIERNILFGVETELEELEKTHAIVQRKLKNLKEKTK